MRLSQYLQGGSNEDDEYDERIPEVDYGFILLPLTHEKRRYNLFKSTEPVRKSRVGFGLGLDLAYVEFGKMSPPAAVYIAGYPNDLKKPGFRYVAGYHTMEDALPYGQLHYKADTSCGYSGGPIIVRSGQEFACIGIQLSKPQFPLSTSNWIVELTLTLLNSNHGAKTAGSGKEFASRGRKITADLIREVYAAAHVNEAQFSNLCIDIFRSDPSASRLVLGLREWSSSNRLHGGRLRANPTLLKPFVRKDSGTDMDSTSFSIMPVAATCGDMLDSEAFHVYYAVVHFLSPSDHSKRCRDTPRVPYFLQLLPSQKYEPENRYACDICATRVLTKSALLKLELPDKRVFPEPELIKEIIKKRKQDDSIPLWFNSAPLVLRTSQRKVGANNEDMGYTCLYARAEDVGIGEDEEESTTGQVTTIGLEEAVAMMQDARPRKKKLLAKVRISLSFSDHLALCLLEAPKTNAYADIQPFFLLPGDLCGLQVHTNGYWEYSERVVSMLETA